MIQPRLMGTLAAAFLLLMALRPVARGQDKAAGTKYAVLIGIKKYDNANFANLDYSERDVVELAKVLKPHGYDVTLLSDSQGATRRPDRATILKQLDAVLDKCKRDDLILVGFAGHGVQFEEDKASYFCPLDASPNRPETMISLKALYEKLEDCGAGVKLMLVDACRVKVKRDRFRGVDGDNTPPPPKGVSVFFSCSAGQAALEMNDLRHGLFFYHVLEGLRGKARNEDGFVTWLDLAGYATRQVKKAGFGQVPVLKGEVADGPVVRPGNPEFTNSIGMTLVRVEPGRFMMGSTKQEQEKVRQDFGDSAGNWAALEKAHDVEIAKAFQMGKYEVTRGQFRKFVEATRYKTDAEKNAKGGFGFDASAKQMAQKPNYTWRQPGFEQTDDHPVTIISWADAKAFCRWLSDQEGKTYSLPTEAEWEYACRAGTASRYYCGETDASVLGFGNVADGSVKKVFPSWQIFPFDDGFAFTAPAGQFQPNRWGLHDMIGNVWEWCEDWHDPKYYFDSPLRDPRGPTAGAERIIRGGSWSFFARNCRSAHRDKLPPAASYFNIGFRVVLH
jgi:sulfatase modifying factor 1